MKRIISKDLEELDIDGSLDDVIKMFESYKVKYSDYTNLRVDADYSYDGGGYTHHLRGNRLETDAEEAARLEVEKTRLEKQTEYERKQYEALKAKFEKQ